MSILFALAAATAGVPAEASIPFFSTVRSPDWVIDGDKGMWIRANTRQWYYAAFMGSCPRAEYAIRLGFKTFGTDTFDKFSTVYAEGDICPLSSLVKSDAPPPKPKRKG